MPSARRGPERAPGLDLADAVAVNLNAMVGAGVFVALGLGADLAGPAMLETLLGAGALALLAASVPCRLTGETRKRVARVSAWLTLMAGIPAAAAAAGMFAAYVAPEGSATLHRWLAAGLAALATALVAGGVKTSPRVDGAFLAVKVGALAFLAGLAIPLVDRGNFHHPIPNGGKGIWEACALLVFAYAGFGRASSRSREGAARTAGQVSVLLAMALYMVVGFAAVGVSGLLFSAKDLAGHPYDAPLLIPASFTNLPAAARAVVIVGAVAAAVSLLLVLLEDAGRAVPDWLPARAPSAPWPVLVAGVAAALLAAFVPLSTLIAFAAFSTLALFAVRLASSGRGAGWPLALVTLALGFSLPRDVVIVGGAVFLLGMAPVLMRRAAE